MRLDKFLANTAGISRTETKKLARAGRITVNGAAALSGDTRLDENSDTVAVDGSIIRWREFVYLMLNKPEGYISATYDRKLPVVTELVPPELAHFEPFPAGRLDIDTTGLLVLTNDGELAHKVISPKKRVYKTYRAYLDAPAEKADTDLFAAGMDLGDFTSLPAVLEIDSDDARSVTVKICEGKFHQVKRMCEKVGKRVVRLERTAIGRLRLDASLERGEARELTAEEVKMMMENE